MSGVAIQPCPFCGYDGHWEGKGTWRVVCTNVTCGAKGPSALYEAQAVIGWNHREPTPSQRLDAATVERCADVAFVAAMKAGRGLEQAQQDAAFVRRALATDPHQHGAGNGEKHGE